MRILHCIPHLVYGGAQRQLSYLAAEMAQTGHQVHVAFLDGGPNLARLAASNVFLHRLSRRNNYDVIIPWQLLRLIQKIEPDVVHTWLGQMDVLGGIAATLARTPWIIREPSSEKAYSTSWKLVLRRWLVGKADAIVSNSTLGDLYWQKYYKSKARYIIPNGLPFQEIESAFPGAFAKLGLPPSKKIVLFVGRFDSQKYRNGLNHVKNLDNFLMALAHLRDEADIVGVFCGDGPHLPAIRQLAKELGISDRVLLLGAVENVWPLMKLADVFVSVSHFEGFPNTVLEAMACGCPLVVSDIPEHRQFLNEEQALLVNRLQPEDIARAIKRTLDNPQEARRRAQMANKLAQKWTIAAMAEQYDRVYREVLAARHH